MSRLKPLTFEGLLAPLSKGKILLLLEVLDPLAGDHFDCSMQIAQHLNISLDKIPNCYEDFMKSGYLLVENVVNDDNKKWGIASLDFFRQNKIKRAVKAYLYINSAFIGHSCDGHSATLDILHDLS